VRLAIRSRVAGPVRWGPTAATFFLWKKRTPGSEPEPRGPVRRQFRGEQGMPPTLTLEKLLGSTLPCFLCGEELAIRTDKNSKRYLICNACGLQAFVRKKDGIKRLEKLASE